MIISSSVNNLSLSYAEVAKSTSQKNSSSVSLSQLTPKVSSIEDSNSYEFKIDMHNISPNEYDALTKAGITDLATPIIFPGGRVHLNGKQAEMADVKADYLAQIENSIEAAKSRGDTQSVEFFSERLKVVQELHGRTVTIQQNFLENLTA